GTDRRGGPWTAGSRPSTARLHRESPANRVGVMFMALDLQPLIDDFHNYFIGLYKQGQAPTPSQPPSSSQPLSPTQAPSPSADQKSGGAFLAFECLGTPITPAMFMLKSGELFDGLVVEQFSALANKLPKIDGESISGDGLLTVDGLYAMLVEQSQPLTAADM